MIRTPEKVLRAMSNLDDNEDYLVIVNWLLDQSLMSAMDSTKIKDGDSMRWVQGESQTFSELHRIFKDARIAIKNIDRSKERNGA